MKKRKFFRNLLLLKLEYESIFYQLFTVKNSPFQHLNEKLPCLSFCAVTFKVQQLQREIQRVKKWILFPSIKVY